MKRKYIKYIIYIYTHEHTHINTHTHTYIYIYIYIYIYSYREGTQEVRSKCTSGRPRQSVFP